jgi:hypothetical protein
MRRASFCIETTIAVAATSSISGFWFLENFVGGYIWKSVGALAVVFTALKPVLRLPDKIRKAEELLASYRALEHDLHCIRIQVHHRQQYDEELRKELLKALRRKAELVKKAGESALSEKLQRYCETEVKRELPASSFYVPK